MLHKYINNSEFESIRSSLKRSLRKEVSCKEVIDYIIIREYNAISNQNKDFISFEQFKSDIIVDKPNNFTHIIHWIPKTI